MSSSNFEQAIQQAVEPGPDRLLPGVALAAASLQGGEIALLLIFKWELMAKAGSDSQYDTTQRLFNYHPFTVHSRLNYLF